MKKKIEKKAEKPEEEKTKESQTKISEAKPLSKENFLRQFAYYFAIIVGLALVAYIIAILPNLLTKKESSINTINTTLSNLSVNESEFNELTLRECNESMTRDSRYYNVKYGLYMNNSYVGYVNYQIKKQTGQSGQGNGYIRSIEYVMNLSALSKTSNESLGANYPQFDSLYKISVLVYYDSDFKCKNAISTIEMSGMNYSENVSCIEPDVPSQICKEDLIFSKETSVSLEAGNFTGKEYTFAGTNESQSGNVVFSDLPFPLLISSPDGELRLSSYSRIE